MTHYLVFDWGDTVMETFPAYAGAMVDWQKVSAVKGIADALQDLSTDYVCVIGTNAQDSDAAQIRAALDRVHVGKYFTEIFTFGELGARKPRKHSTAVLNQSWVGTGKIHDDRR